MNEYSRLFAARTLRGPLCGRRAAQLAAARHQHDHHPEGAKVAPRGPLGLAREAMASAAFCGRHRYSGGLWVLDEGRAHSNLLYVVRFRISMSKIDFRI